jgi:hypothetical protein
VENLYGKFRRKILAENLGGYPEFRRLVKIQAYDRTMADVEISADFLLVWLKSSRSDPCRCVDSQTCRPQVI